MKYFKVKIIELVYLVGLSITFTFYLWGRDNSFHHKNNIARRIKDDLPDTDNFLEKYLSDEEKENLLHYLDNFVLQKKQAMVEIQHLIEKIEQNGIMEIRKFDRNKKDIHDLLILIPKIAEFCQYDLKDFSKILKKLFPFPSNVIEIFLKEVNSPEELVQYLDKLQEWIKEYKEDTKIVIKRKDEFLKIYRKAFGEIGAWELNIPSYCLWRKDMRRHYESFGGKTLRNFLYIYRNIWKLKEDLDLIPVSFEEWLNFILRRKTITDGKETINAGDIRHMSKSVIREFLMKGFAEKYPLLWEITPDEEKFAVFYYLTKDILLEKFKFLNGGSLYPIANFYYAIKGKDFSYLRKDIGIPPKNIEELIVIIKKSKIVTQYGIGGFIWWGEFKNLHWELFNMAFEERFRQEKYDDPSQVPKNEFSNSFDFLDGISLNKFVNYYKTYDNFKKYMIDEQYGYWIDEFKKNKGMIKFKNNVPQWIQRRWLRRLLELSDVSSFYNLQARHFEDIIIPELGYSLEYMLFDYNGEIRNMLYQLGLL